MINPNRYFLDIAETVSQQATCLDKQVGCVIVSPDRQIIACGYNGAPARVKDCKQRECCMKRNNYPCLATHAEINALIKAGDRAKGGTLYVTLEPCFECAKASINAGITRVIFRKLNDKNAEYKSYVANILNAAGVIYEQVEE